MKLNPQLAQSIVDNMMKQIPYNINIMDERGYIIASGDPGRINTLHIGAVDAINQGKMLPMDGTYGNHGQPGVNMPITYKNQVIGVVGITGDPTKVVPLASLLKTAVELLLKQKANNQQKQEREKSRQRFLYHLIQSTKEQPASPNLIAEGQQFGIDLTISKTVIAIHCQPNELETLNNDPTNCTFMLANAIGLIIIQDNLIVEKLQNKLTAQKRIFGIGETGLLIGKSAEQAITTLKLQMNLGEYNLNHYHQVQFMDLLLKGNLPIQPIIDQFNELAKTETGKELILTIKEFVKCNLNINQTAKKLFTHRNTINYRLERIQKIFHLDPKQVTDLFQLLVGYLYFANPTANKNDDLPPSYKY